MREGLFDKEVAQLFLACVEDCREARVLSVAHKPRSKSPPIALHTVELLRAASSKLHMGPKVAMDYAERLYTEVYTGHVRGGRRVRMVSPGSPSCITLIWPLTLSIVYSCKEESGGHN